LSDNIRQLLSAHLDFLHTTGQLSVQDMMGPLREYAQVWCRSSTGLCSFHPALADLPQRVSLETLLRAAL
jgi:hypothetical protein